MKLIKWGKHPEMDNIWLEDSLREIYRPIQPRAEFVRKLRGQLVNQLASVQMESRFEKRRLAWVVGASLVGGALAFLMGMRTVITLGMAVGILMELKKPVNVIEVDQVKTTQ